MSMFEDVLKGGSVPGIAAAIGAALVAPTVLPALGRVLRPAAKAAIKGGIVLYRQTVPGFGESMRHLVDEARHELATTPSGETTPTTAGTGARKS